MEKSSTRTRPISRQQTKGPANGHSREILLFSLSGVPPKFIGHLSQQSFFYHST
jgi:hypothetical protein